MTSGTVTLDRAVVTPSASGDGLVGRRESKTWSGTDWPKVKPTYSYTSVPHVRKKYSVRFGKRVVDYEQIYKIRRIRDRPPKRARNEDHPYSMIFRRTDYQIWQQRNNPYQGFSPTRYGFDTYMLEIDTPWGANDELKLLGKLREAVAGSSFNAGVALGESREALSMITNAAMRIYWGYRAVRQGDFRSAQRYLLSGTDRERKFGRAGTSRLLMKAEKTTAQNWLELQYGWLPLLNDAHEGAVFLAHHFAYPIQHVVRVSSQKIHAVKTLNPGTSPIGGRSYTRKSIKAILKEKDVISLAGLTDPLSVAWELAPYSLVLDWFIPIGNYLSARGLANSLTGTFVTSTKTYQRLDGLKGGTPSQWGPSVALSPCEKVSDLVVTLDRTVSTGLSIPLPEIKPLGEILSWKKAANAVALLTNFHK